MLVVLEIILILSFFVKIINVGIDCNGFEYIFLCYLRFFFDVLRNFFINFNFFNNGYYDYFLVVEVEKFLVLEVVEVF